MSDDYQKRPIAGDVSESEFFEEEFDAEHADESDEGFDESSEYDGTEEDDDGPYPRWEGEVLQVPPRWRGQLSEILFATRAEPNGTLVIAEIPGEVTTVVSALCTDGEGLMDTCFGIDAAISVASEPEEVPDEFLSENAMQLHVAITIFREAALRMDHSLDDAYCPPDKAREFKAQASANAKGAAMLRSAAERIESAIAAVTPPLLVAAARYAEGMNRIH